MHTTPTPRYAKHTLPPPRSFTHPPSPESSKPPLPSLDIPHLGEHLVVEMVRAVEVDVMPGFPDDDDFDRAILALFFSRGGGGEGFGALFVYCFFGCVACVCDVSWVFMGEEVVRRGCAYRH